MICCVTGNRPKGFPFVRDKCNEKFNIYLEMLDAKVEALIANGYDRFISGFADGADIDFAVCVINKMKRNKDIVLEAALPYPKTNEKMYQEHGLNFCDLMANVTTVTEVSDRYFRGCMQKRNRFMVDNSDFVLAIWNGEESGGTWYTVNYALNKSKTVRFINLCDI